jgi:chromosome partitioning protein
MRSILVTNAKGGCGKSTLATNLAAFYASEGYETVLVDYEYVVIDAPARSHGRELTELVRRAESILVPVLPSPIDIKAAHRFIDELMQVHKVADRKARVAVVANRVRDNTLIADELDEYLDSLKAPYIANLREAQNYIRAYQRGLGIHELPPYLAWPDWEQWDPILEWLDSKRSQAR